MKIWLNLVIQVKYLLLNINNNNNKNEKYGTSDDPGTLLLNDNDNNIEI